MAMDENPYRAPEGEAKVAPAAAWQETLWRRMLLGGFLSFAMLFAFAAYVGAGLWINLGHWQMFAQCSVDSVACLAIAYWLRRRWRRSATHR